MALMDRSLLKSREDWHPYLHSGDQSRWPFFHSEDAGHHAISTTPPIASRQLHIRAPDLRDQYRGGGKIRIALVNGTDGNTFHFRPEKPIMQSIEGYVDYTRREFCHDVTCPIQSLLDIETEKSTRYEEIRAICAAHCLHTAHEFHRWLIEKGYLIVKPQQE